MALLNTDIVYATIGPKTSSSEFISFTGITQNSDGTATLTGVTRGLAKKYPLTENSTFKLPHSGQTTFILSDAPQVFGLQYAALKNDNIFTGQNEVPAPLDDADIANKGYVDALVNGGTVSNNRIVVAGVAGETLTIGQHVYYKTSDGRWWKTDADDATITYGVQTGIAQGAGTAGNNVTSGILLEGVDTNNTGTSGATAYIGNTAGALSETVGTNTRAVGKYLPALAGIYYNPNLFVKYPQNTQSVYAVDSVGTDSYAITLTPAPGSYTDGMTVTFKAGTANTGACTLNVNGLGAKTIKKFGSFDTVTGDVASGQDVTVVYDGTNFQLQTPTTPTPINVINYTVPAQIATSTTRFDVTNPSGTTFRYTYDGTGTDPVINGTTYAVGAWVLVYGNFTAGNNGLFTITGSGTNYFEVTNASGVVENDRSLSSSGILLSYAKTFTYTKPANLSFIEVEGIAGGGGGGGNTTASSTSGGGGSGAYFYKKLNASALGVTETVTVGASGYGGIGTGGTGTTGGSTTFGSICSATGGVGGVTGTTAGVGGVATGGDVNRDGTPGYPGGAAATIGTGRGADSQFGAGKYNLSVDTVTVYSLPGTGGPGAVNSAGGDLYGSPGGWGQVIIKEYFY
jgi:hypothetical protein